MILERILNVSNDYALSNTEAKGRFWVRALDACTLRLPTPRPKDMIGPLAVFNDSAGDVVVSCPGHFGGGSDEVLIGPQKAVFLAAVLDGKDRQWMGYVVETPANRKSEIRVDAESSPVSDPGDAQGSKEKRKSRRKSD